MENSLRWFVLLLLAATAASAIERLAVDEFAREPETANVRLAPDGKHFAFLSDYAGVTKLHVSDIERKKIVRISFGGAPILQDAPKEIDTFEWVNDHRLVVVTKAWDMIYGMLATDRDGGHNVPLSGWEGMAGDRVYLQGPAFFGTEIVHRFLDKSGSILMLDRSRLGSHRPDIVRVDSMTGARTVVLKNPGEVSHWGFDFDGVPRYGILTHGELSGAIYRESEGDEFKTVLPLKNRTGDMRVVGFDAVAKRLLVTMLNEQQRWTIFPLDPASGTVGPPLLSDPIYDIVPNRGLPGAAGIELARTFFSRAKRTFAGVRYYTDAARVKWFDREYAAYQKAVDRALPNTVNVLVDTSADERQFLWFAFSDQDPGSYYLTDQDKRSFKLLAATRSWIKPGQMAPMLSVKYQARDGLTIFGYLTVPVGSQPKDLPLVVMPHGGPWVRDIWGFDPLVQLLANRGYAVLQMNYRGSTGFGHELFENAKLQIGKQIQNDIEDGTRWAIAAGVADPKRIAIVGSSYGGYSALFGLGNSPGMYRCGISIAGVTDWPAIYEDSEAAESKSAKKYWREQIGDPAKDLESLQSISPVYFASRITAPLLIVHGKKDRRVPYDQAKRLISALESAGRPPATLILPRVAHSYGDEKERTEIYKRIVGFLETNLGPGVN